MAYRRWAAWISGALLVLAVSAGSALPAQTPAGYWKYASYGVEPRPEDIPKVSNRLFEQRATGTLDVAAGAFRLDCLWNTDDADRKPYTMLSGFVLGADRNLSILIPGQKIPLKAAASVTGNSNAAALPADAVFTAGVGLGELLNTGHVRIGRHGSDEKPMVVPGGGPGATLVLWIHSYMASMGAFISQMNVAYVWVEGTPPSLPALKPGGIGAPDSKFPRK